MMHRCHNPHSNLQKAAKSLICGRHAAAQHAAVRREKSGKTKRPCKVLCAVAVFFLTIGHKLSDSKMLTVDGLYF